MTKLMIHGYLGAMGQIVGLLADQMEIVPFDVLSQEETVYRSFDQVPDFDVIIDFSHYSIVDSLIDFAQKRNKPLVICTTNLSDETKRKIEEASKSIPIFQSGNMSLGINVMLTLVKQASAVLKDFDVEIIEKHHNQKIDAPSGTAKMIVSAVEGVSEKEKVYGRQGDTGKRKNEIGIHAIRGGSIVGEHSILFAGQDEVLEIKHQAASKKIFAKGAIEAAKFLLQQEAGFYNMEELVKEQLNVL